MNALQHRMRYSFFAALLTILVFAIGEGTVFASPANLSEEDQHSWAWSGISVDQNAIQNQEGTVTESAIGWIHLNCESDSSCSNGTGRNPQVTIDVDPGSPTAGQVSGWAWIGLTDTAGAPAVGWIDFDPDPDYTTYPECGYPEADCVDARIDTTNQQELYGWARVMTLAQYGEQTYGTKDWGWVQLKGNTAVNTAFGVRYHNDALDGWAWSGGGTIPGGMGTAADTNATGFGWIRFSPEAGGTDTGPVDGYITTEQGDVYSGGGISNPNNTPQPNATYLIFANGTVRNFQSSKGNSYVDATAGNITFPDSTGDYTSDIGKLDITKLTTVTDGSKNIYGDEVASITPDNLYGQKILDGQVLVIGDPDDLNQTYTLEQTTTFLNPNVLPAAGSNFDGSGTIIVNGNLQVNASMYYEQDDELLDIKNLASVAWIVRGDLIISPNVSQLVGAFFVIGDESIGDAENDGTVLTGASETSRLEVYGLMMARVFNFQRTFEGGLDQDQPAERFYYDGRILKNTPPGLRDFTSTLPVIQ